MVKSVYLSSCCSAVGWGGQGMPLIQAMLSSLSNCQLLSSVVNCYLFNEMQCFSFRTWSARSDWNDSTHWLIDWLIDWIYWIVTHWLFDWNYDSLVVWLEWDCGLERTLDSCPVACPHNLHCPALALCHWCLWPRGSLWVCGLVSWSGNQVKSWETFKA